MIESIMRALTCWACLIVAAGTPLAAQNLVKNPGFATNFNSWVTNVSPGVDFAWTSTDANGAPNSGSARIDNQQANAGSNTSPIWQCIPILGHDFKASMKSRIPSGQDRTGSAALYVSWYSDAGCVHDVAFEVLNNSTVGPWVETSQNLVAPTGALSALVYIGVTKNEAGGQLRAFLDDISVSLIVPPNCTPSDTTLCLDDVTGDKRFQAEISFHTTQSGGVFGLAHAIPLTSLGVDHGGIFWFFSAGNPEVLIKVLNGCGVNDHFWVFYSAGTNVGLRVAVADTDTGEVFYSDNPDLHPAPPGQFVNALPCN
jgi:hypothetical protein